MEKDLGDHSQALIVLGLGIRTARQGKNTHSQVAALWSRGHSMLPGISFDAFITAMSESTFLRLSALN